MENQPYTSSQVSWTKRDVLLFNASIGCQADELHFLYENHPHFAAFPTIPLSLVFKLSNQEVIDFRAFGKDMQVPGGPFLDSKRLVDGQRKIEIHQTLPTSSEGRDFEFRSKTLGIFDKGKAGTIVKSEDVLLDAASGEAYARIEGSLFYVGQGGWGGLRGPREPGCPVPCNRPADLSFSFIIAQQASYLYRLNGDYNPLHADPAIGKSMGHGGVILHGVYAYNRIACESVRRLRNSDPSSLRQFQAKFAGVVKPGDEIKVELWKMNFAVTDEEEFRWRASVSARCKPCLTDGRIVLSMSASGTSQKL